VIATAAKGQPSAETMATRSAGLNSGEKGQHQGLAFLKALGKDLRQTYFRTIGLSRCNRARRGADLCGFDSAALDRDNRAEAVYLVVGNATGASGKAVTDADVLAVPALFCEWDDRPIEWQISAWRELGLPEPSLIVTTGGKSAHLYWVLDKPMPAADWQVMQRRLLEHSNADRSLCNPSRVMRLPGFRYIDKSTGKPTDSWCELRHSSATCYSAAELEACLTLPLERAATATASRQRRSSMRGNLEQIREAAAFIPKRVVGGNTYEESRNALCGCAAALAAAGSNDPHGDALQLLADRWPDRRTASQVLESTTTREAKSFWSIAKENGYNSSHRSATSPHPRKSPQLKVLQGGGAEPSTKRVKLAPDEVLAGLLDRVGRLRLDVRSGDVHTQRIGTLSGNAISRLYLRLSSPGETWPKDSTVDAVAELATADPFDPVADYLEGITEPALTLDQWDRLDRHLLGIDDPIAAAFLPRYLVSAVARVFEPGCSVRQSPVLIGPQQRGKTAMGQILFSGPLYVEGVKDLGKDALMRCHRAWGVELAELNGITRRADQEALKAFLTEVVDTYRRPYDRAPEAHPRRFVFWGTANAAPLRDLSGSTRFVCIPIPDRMLPLDWAIANRDSLWARALEQHRAGVQWDRSTEDERAAVAERNANHQEIDPWADRVAEFLDDRRRSGDLPVRLPEVLDRLAVPAERQTNALATRVRSLAEAMGWTWARRWISRKEGIKRQGLWPPVAHPVPPMAHPGPTPAESSGGNSSAPCPTPSHPYPERVVEKGGAAGGQDSAAQQASGAAPGGFEPLGVGQVGHPGNSSGANGSQPTPGVGPEWGTGVGHASSRTVLAVGDVVEVLIGKPPAWVNGYRIALIEGDRVVVVKVNDQRAKKKLPAASVRVTDRIQLGKLWTTRVQGARLALIVSGNHFDR